MIPTFGAYADLVRMLAAELHRAIYVDHDAVSALHNSSTASDGVTAPPTPPAHVDSSEVVGAAVKVNASEIGDGTGATTAQADSGSTLPASVGVRSGQIIGYGQSEMYLRRPVSTATGTGVGAGGGGVGGGSGDSSGVGFGRGATAAAVGGRTAAPLLGAGPDGLGGPAGMDYFRGTTFFSRARQLNTQIQRMKAQRYAFVGGGRRRAEYLNPHLLVVFLYACVFVVATVGVAGVLRFAESLTMWNARGWRGKWSGESLCLTSLCDTGSVGCLPTCFAPGYSSSRFEGSG